MRGGLMGVGVLLILHLPQAAGNLYSTLHCIALTQTKRLRKEIKYILIHNNILQSFVKPSIALKIHVSHFEAEYFYLWFLYKSDSRISCFRNDGEMKVSKVHRTCHSINGNYACIPFKYNYIV